MSFFQFVNTQKLPVDKATLWDFISSPQNLKTITPDYMGFEVTSKRVGEKMYEGMIISYKVSPLLNIKMTWVTEITHMKEGEYFVDEQRVGPYSLWHHEHFISSIEHGTLMQDIISYKPPLRMFNGIVNHLFIEKKLNEIFNYRQKILHQIFGKYSTS